MGQAAGAWCSEGLVINGDAAAWSTRAGAQSRSRPREELPTEADQLLDGCPRELGETLREAGQWGALRCKPWLSAAALRGLQCSLQRCQLQKLTERYREAETPEECTYALPPVIRWADLDMDHVISAGQVFRGEDASHEKVWQLRRSGLQVLRQGKVGVVLLAGGVSSRLGGPEPPPVGCLKRMFALNSGKSILQLCCERVRRIAVLARGSDDTKTSGASSGGSNQRAHLSIPVFVMTSSLTHRRVLEHFEMHRYFGLSARDVFFFEQPVFPVLSTAGLLLPQSLGGDFAHAPGGTGQLLRSLTGSSALEMMRDRGVECLHIVGTENILARICDPVFLGFCRELDVECACKIVDREEPDEDLELFCIRQSPVSTQFADIEEAAAGVTPAEAPVEALRSRTTTGRLSYAGVINSVFMAVPYIEDVVGRPIRPHRVARVVPYLDFHAAAAPASTSTGAGAQASANAPASTSWAPPQAPRQGDGLGAVGRGGSGTNGEDMTLAQPLRTTPEVLGCNTAATGGQEAGVDQAPRRSLDGAGEDEEFEAGPVDEHEQSHTSQLPPPVAVAAFRRSLPGGGSVSSGTLGALPGALRNGGEGVHGVRPGTWPPEAVSTDLARQRALTAAAAEVRSACKPHPDDREDAWRCEVHLDSSGPLAIVRVRDARRGPQELRDSVGPLGPSTSEAAAATLRCSLVVPSKANAFILEISLLDYFAYTDRAVAFQVARGPEFAATCELKGRFTPEAARRALHMLHVSWVIAVGGSVDDGRDPDALIEISPLLSYEGEGIVLAQSCGLGASNGTGGGGPKDGPPKLRLPKHLAGVDEVEMPPMGPSGQRPGATAEDASDGLDTRLFYLQEYPQRIRMSQSQAPQFRNATQGALSGFPTLSGAAGAAGGAKGLASSAAPGGVSNPSRQGLFVQALLNRPLG